MPNAVKTVFVDSIAGKKIDAASKSIKHSSNSRHTYTPTHVHPIEISVRVGLNVELLFFSAKFPFPKNIRESNLKFAFEHIQFLEQANGAFVKYNVSFGSTFEHAFSIAMANPSTPGLCVCRVIPHEKRKSRPINRPIDRLTDWRISHALSTLNDDSRNWNAHPLCYVELSLDVICCCCRCCCYAFTCHRYWRQFYLNFKHCVLHSIIYMHIRFPFFPLNHELVHFLFYYCRQSRFSHNMLTYLPLILFLSRNQLKTYIIINKCGVKIVNGCKKIESKVTKWKQAEKKKAK